MRDALFFRDAKSGGDRKAPRPPALAWTAAAPARLSQWQPRRRRHQSRATSCARPRPAVGPRHCRRRAALACARAASGCPSYVDPPPLLRSFPHTCRWPRLCFPFSFVCLEITATRRIGGCDTWPLARAPVGSCGPQKVQREQGIGRVPSGQARSAFWAGNAREGRGARTGLQKPLALTHPPRPLTAALSAAGGRRCPPGLCAHGGSRRLRVYVRAAADMGHRRRWLCH